MDYQNIKCQLLFQLSLFENSLINQSNWEEKLYESLSVILSTDFFHYYC